MLTPLDMILKESMDKEDLEIISKDEADSDILEYALFENDPHEDINALFPIGEEEEEEE